MSAALRHARKQSDWSSKIAAIAVIGGGLAGLTAAIRLAEDGADVTLFEAAPTLGGRTRSFVDRTTGVCCDNGPHLLVGAYHRTIALLQEATDQTAIHWQPTLDLPLWAEDRGHFHFRPSRWLPFPMALLHAAAALPAHHADSAIAMLKLARAMRGRIEPQTSVTSWLTPLQIPAALQRDLLEPLCLGAMNEPGSSANAASFARVLSESFSCRNHARLGWFTAPLAQALIAPLQQRATALGVQLKLRHRIHRLDADNSQVHLIGAAEQHASAARFDAAILALPAHARDKILHQPGSATPTSPITNIHLWYREPHPLPAPLVGGIGTRGHWFFDLTAMHTAATGNPTQRSPAQHICVVISADTAARDHSALLQQVNRELHAICHRGNGHTTNSCKPHHYRIITEQRATALVRPQAPQPPLPASIIDAAEMPQPGELPATIELAVQRGEAAAQRARQRFS